MSLKLPAVALVLGLAGCAAPSSPPLTAKLMTFSCDTGPFTEAAIAIRNTSSVPIEYATLYVQLGDAIETRRLRPLVVPPGAVATADVGRRGQYTCELIGVQDERGNAVELLH